MTLLQKIASVCPHDCPSACALEAERDDQGRLLRIYGSKRNRTTAGIICAKVARYQERLYHPERLKTPLKRFGDKGVGLEAFQPISWEEALDTVAETFLKAEQLHGCETVWPYFYYGTMGRIMADGLSRLTHAKNYSRLDKTICTRLGRIGWQAGVGKNYGSDLTEIQDSDLTICWGVNAVATQINMMKHVVLAKKRNPHHKLVVIDPYRNATAKKADMHLPIRPGSDGALACAMMHVMFRDGTADRNYMARYCDAPADLEDHLKQRDPVWASRITGLDPQQIEDFATLYGRTQHAFIRFGLGFTRQRNGAVQLHAASCLPAVGGKWQYKGGGGLFMQGDCFSSLDVSLIEGTDRFACESRLLDMSLLGKILKNDPTALKGGPPVTAMILQNTNPMQVCPDSHAVREGMMREGLFLCVHEQFMTETAAMADIVLPATMFPEHDDIYTSFGHGILQISKAFITPPSECRNNHQVVAALAKRLGAEHPGFCMTPWELIDDMLQRSGLMTADQIYQKGGHDMTMPFRKAHFLDGFGHQDGKFHFYAAWEEGKISLPDHMDLIDAPDDEKPFRLVTAPAHSFLNSTFSETESSINYEQKPKALIHADICKEKSINEGDMVRIGNQRGSIILSAMPVTGQDKNTIIVEGLWQAKAFAEGVGVNSLVSSERAFPNGGAAFHDTAIWLKKEEITSEQPS